MLQVLFSVPLTLFRACSSLILCKKGLIHMEIIKLPDKKTVIEAMQNNEPMITAIRNDGKVAILAPLDYGFEHNILIAKAGYNQTDRKSTRLNSSHRL